MGLLVVYEVLVPLANGWGLAGIGLGVGPLYGKLFNCPFAEKGTFWHAGGCPVEA